MPSLVVFAVSVSDTLENEPATVVVLAVLAVVLALFAPGLRSRPRTALSRCGRPGVRALAGHLRKATSPYREPGQLTDTACGVDVRKLTAVAMVVALVFAAVDAQAKPEKIRGPFLLVSLPAMGTVTWRCDRTRKPGVAPGLPGLALGFRAFRQSATDYLRLRAAGRLILDRYVQPGQTVRLPFLQSTVQTIEIVQATGAGTLRASVKVNFLPGTTSTYCFPYLPPRVEVRLGPRG